MIDAGSTWLHWYEVQNVLDRSHKSPDIVKMWIMLKIAHKMRDTFSELPKARWSADYEQEAGGLPRDKFGRLVSMMTR